MNISGISIGAGQPCRFVAELSNAWRVQGGEHETDRQRRDRMGRLIDAAKAAGADFVKLQCYTPDELVALRGDGPAPEPWGSQGFTMRTLYERAATPFEWFPHVKAHCERIGLPWFSSVFGPDSLALLESMDCPAYKIARLDNTQRDFIASVVATGRPVIVSQANEFEAKARNAAAFLKCPKGYPQTDFRLDAYDFHPDAEGWVPFQGFSFHGTDPLPCIVAATLGAKIIECHLQLYSEPSELEANVSLTQKQFREMIRQVRRIEGMLA